MPARLDPAERERRRKERSRRSFSDAAYEHYDPAKEGFGSSAEWVNTANERLGVGTIAAASDDADLTHFGLTAYPRSEAELTALYRKLAKTKHPNAGGSHDDFIAFRAAYDRLRAKVSV